MAEYVNLKPLVYQMLTPNDTLDVRLFDFRGKMYPEVREQLLVDAQYIVKETIKGIEGLVVADVYLSGSSAGYFYSDASDIDIGIEVHNEGCPYLTKDEDKLADFLLKLFCGNCGKIGFVLGNRPVDINLETKDKEIVGLYSLVQDKWIIEPRKDIFSGIGVEDVWADYIKRYEEIYKYIDEIKLSGKLKEKQGILDLSQYFRGVLKKSLESPREYIIYKLLKKRLVFVDIGRVIYESWQDYLSIK